MTVGIVKASIATVRSAFTHRCCSSVRPLPKCVRRNAIFSKTKQFRAMVSFDNL